MDWEQLAGGRGKEGAVVVGVWTQVEETLQPGKELKSIEASSHRQPMAMASLCLGNKINQIRAVTWLFQKLVSGMATKQMTRLERAPGFSISRSLCRECLDSETP